MTEVKAFAAQTPGAELAPFTIERRAVGPDDVQIEIKYCGICHSDIHQAHGDWGASIFPMVPGHEIAGVVTAVGQQVADFKIGDRVGVGCFVDSCRSLGHHVENEQYESDLVQTYNDRDRDGQPTHGGYSGSIVVKQGYVLRIPDSIPLDMAAPLLCAGITLYSPLAHWKAGPGKKVAIIGMGGLGHMGVQIAHAMGADVTVLSQSLSKETAGRRLGADHYYATSDPETFKTLDRTFDLIINTVSAPIDWNAYLQLLKVDGTMVIVGIPEKPNEVQAFPLVGGRRSLAGSMIGSIRETQEMLDFCARHNIAAEIETIAMADVNAAWERVLNSDVRFRFVIDMATL